MLTKYAEMRVLEASRGAMRPSSQVTAGKRTAHRAVFAYEPREGFIYVRSRAISSRCNDNFDEFPAEEIKKAYSSFVGKPVFVNHHNDDHRRARGVILDAVLHEDVNPDGSPDTWVEVLMEVDAVKFPKLAKAILAGHIDRTSMGTDVAYSVCSVCANKAASPLEYCQHIPAMKGQTVWKTTASGSKEGVLVRELCYGLHFFENSLLVEDPADPTAFFLGVDDRGVGGGYEGNVKVTARRKHADRPENSWERGYNTEYEKLKEEILKDGPKCAICKKNKATEVDHIKSLKDGGGNTKSNLRPACKSCNRKDGGGERSDPKKSSLEVAEMGKRNRRRQREAALAGRTASRKHAYGEVKAPQQVDTLRDEEDEMAPVPPFADPDLDAAREMDLREELGEMDGGDGEQVDESLLSEISEVLNEVREMLAPDGIEEQVRDQLADLKEMLEVSDELGDDEDSDDEAGEEEDGEADEDGEDDLPEFMTADDDEDDEDSSPVGEAGSPKEGVNRRRSLEARRMSQGRRRQAAARRVHIEPRLAGRRPTARRKSAIHPLFARDEVFDNPDAASIMYWYEQGYEAGFDVARMSGMTAQDIEEFGVDGPLSGEWAGQSIPEIFGSWEAATDEAMDSYEEGYYDGVAAGASGTQASRRNARRRPTARRRTAASTMKTFGELQVGDVFFMADRRDRERLGEMVLMCPVGRCVHEQRDQWSAHVMWNRFDRMSRTEGFQASSLDAPVEVVDHLNTAPRSAAPAMASRRRPTARRTPARRSKMGASMKQYIFGDISFDNATYSDEVAVVYSVDEIKMFANDDDADDHMVANGYGGYLCPETYNFPIVWENGSRSASRHARRTPVRNTTNRNAAGSPTARRTTARSKKMSATLKTLAEVKRLLQEVKKNQRAVQAQVEYIGKAAGLERQLKVVRKRADVENPAQPIPEPTPAPAAYSTEETRDHTDADLLTPGGVAEVSDVSEDLNVDLLEAGGVWDVELTDGGDVTVPVAGTTEQRPYDETVINAEVQYRGLDTELAYEESQPLFGEEAKEARFVAALRLARLRLQAGIATGDDLTLATSISQSKMKTSAIRQEIKTLDEVVKAGSKKPVSRTAARRLVPKAAGRTAPSMAAEAAVTSPTAPLAVSSEEFLWD